MASPSESTRYACDGKPTMKSAKMKPVGGQLAGLQVDWASKSNSPTSFWLPHWLKRRRRISPPTLIEWAPLIIEMLRSEEHTSELQSLRHLVCRLLLEKKKN